jgi:uncharacterized protein YcbX
MTVRVATLRSCPVKGLNQVEVATLDLVAAGIAGDRRFVLVDAAGRALYGADLARLAGSTAHWDADGETLAIAFPDGETISAPVETGEPLDARAYGDRPVPGVLVRGPFADACSERAGQPLRLTMTPVGRGAPGPVTVLSLASAARVGAALGVPGLSPRRFKMNIEIDGVEAHAEDGWAGRDLRIGSAVVRIGGQVPRCVLMTRDPDTQVRDHDTLRAILSYREPMAKGEPPLGVYATVVEPGRIAIGDPVEPA